MNRMKSCLAVLLALFLAAGSLQEPVFAMIAGRYGNQGTANETGTVDPTQVTETEPLKLQPEGSAPEDETFSVTIDMDGGCYLGTVHDDATGQDVTAPASFLWKVKKGRVLYFDVSRIAYMDDTRAFVGWSLERDGDVLSDNARFTPVQDCTLFAVWRILKKVTDIRLSAESLTLDKGASAQLTVTVEPDDADNKDVTWTTSDGKVAAVDEYGLVTAVGKGTAVITAEAADGSGKKASCTITVRQPVEKITLSSDSLTLFKGKTAALTAVVDPENADNRSVVWSTSNSAVATVDAKGTVKGIGKGTAAITAAAKDGSGQKASCTVTVRQPVTKIALNKTTLILGAGKTASLSATVTPSTADNKAVKWTSSNKSVATVSASGKVTAKGKGTATITAAAADGSGVKASCTVTVRKKFVSKITLNRTELALQVNKAATLTTTVSPSNADLKTVVWTSSNKSVATVSDKGKVTAKKKGSAEITATAADGSGVKAVCTVTVVKKLVTKITLTQKTLSLKDKKGVTIKATITPANADVKTLVWKSSNKKVATVSANGKVTPVSKGTVTIKATATDGSGVAGTCKVTVK